MATVNITRYDSYDKNSIDVRLRRVHATTHIEDNVVDGWIREAIQHLESNTNECHYVISSANRLVIVQREEIDDTNDESKRYYNVTVCEPLYDALVAVNVDNEIPF
jgi:hypothetical protein